CPLNRTRFFHPPPARQRRKLICLLSPILCPLKLSSVLSNICLLTHRPSHFHFFVFHPLEAA
ncbi:MAG: hypothetical protein LBD06_07560, partial [Candidatus Accumulibacter sp.]|nr:hypothetical protein [Accumulibacter sp.]